MLRELKTFLAIAQCGTFLAAGERIGLSQSAVSAQIKRLQDDFQVVLFERSGRSAHLSDAGRSLVVLAQKLLLSYDEMREELQGQQPGGTLRIGAIPSAQIGLLPDALVNFRKQCPRVELKISPGTSTQLLDQLDANELDIVIVIRPPYSLPKLLHWQPLLTEPYVLIVPKEVRAKTAVEVLENYPFIRYDRLSFGGRPVQRFLNQQRIAVTTLMELKELEAIVRMVESGLGVSIIPRAKILSLQSRKVKVVPLETTFYREIGIIESDVGSRKTPIAELTACLQKAAGGVASRKRSR